MSDEETAKWKDEQYQRAIKHFRGALEKIPSESTDIKRKIQLELAEVLFDSKNFDEAVKIYEDGFCVSTITTMISYLCVLCYLHPSLSSIEP